MTSPARWREPRGEAGRPASPLQAGYSICLNDPGALCGPCEWLLRDRRTGGQVDGLDTLPPGVGAPAQGPMSGEMCSLPFVLGCPTPGDKHLTKTRAVGHGRFP